ncbi:MAG: hypothetical protein HY877_03695 [Deltaproteobacteria bacterium]|nr:hypothetical protein [Deltaproteobacteria bacterium]
MSPIFVTTKRDKARALRAQGLSYGEIFSVIKASKSSISIWCRDIQVNPTQKIFLKKRGGVASKRGQHNKLNRAKEIEQIKQSASKEIGPLTSNEFKLAGLMLYWAEGGKTTRQIDFTNSNPKIIVLMMQRFRKICEIDNSRFRIQLHLHSGQKEESIKAFWSSLMGIPLEQSYKSYIKKEGTGHRKNKLYCGTVKIRVCNGNLLQKILGWIEGTTQQLWAVSSVGRAGDSIKGPTHCEMSMQTG